MCEIKFCSRLMQSVNASNFTSNFGNYGMWCEYILFFRGFLNVTVTSPSLDKMGGWKKVFTKLKIFRKKTTSASVENGIYNRDFVTKGFIVCNHS